MPFLDSIVGLINEGIEQKLSASKVVLSLKGISKQLPRTDTDSTQIPVYVDNSGEGEFNAIDDNYSVTIYHKCEGLTYESVTGLEFGDSQNFSRETASMALFCHADRKRLQMTQEWLASVVAAGFPSGVTKSFKQQKTGLSDATISITIVENNSQTVWAREFVNIAYPLPPESILFQINYLITTDYNKACIELCEECPPIEPRVSHCTPVCEYLSTIFLFLDGQISDIDKCVGGEMQMGGLRLSELVDDSTPLKTALINEGCNEDIEVAVTVQPGTFFYDILVTNACQDICCLLSGHGTDDSAQEWDADFVQSNCQDI